jgi:excisionase family DNA binding protein
MTPENLLTVKDAAKLLAVKPRTIYGWVAERRIPFKKAGRLLRFDRTELLAWAAAQAEDQQGHKPLRVVNW